MADRDLSRPDHLPHRRPGGRAPDPTWLPRQRQGISPQMIGRFPDFDVMAQAHTWDEATRDVVMQRLAPAGSLRFFTPDEEPTLRAFCDTLLAQDRDPRVPVPEMVDEKFADGRFDGYRYATMPRDDETWRIVLAGLDEAAGADGFAALAPPERERVIGEFADGKLSGGAWERVDVDLAWKVVTRAALAAFYAHPWAWNEIGFGGPAYPRGFMRRSATSTLEPYETPGATSEDPVRVEGDR